MPILMLTLNFYYMCFASFRDGDSQLRHSVQVFLICILFKQNLVSLLDLGGIGTRIAICANDMSTSEKRNQM